MPTKKVVSRPAPTSRLNKGKQLLSSSSRTIATNREKGTTLKQWAQRKPLLARGSKNRINKKGVPGQKRYRRVIVLRPCVIRLVFLVPIAVLAIERYLGFIISLDDVKDVYYDQMGIDPWDLQSTTTKTEKISKVGDIANLTYTPPIQCPSGQRRMMSAHNPHLHGLDYRKIPNIIHQMANTRCLTRNFERAAIQWAFRRYSYYFHDRNAVERLVYSDFPEFPQLKLLNDFCLEPVLSFGLWKYLVLWSHGGIVADLNTFPTQFNATTVSNEDDGFFLLEEDSDTISTKVMAVSPRHPLMYYAIQHAMSNILHMQPKVVYHSREVVGEGALNQAMTDFLRSSTKHRLWKKDKELLIQEGMLEGMYGRTIRIGGRMSRTDQGIVTHIFISSAREQREFGKIGMKSLEQIIAGSNCVESLLHRMRNHSSI